MSSNNRNRRRVLGVDIAVGAALVAAMIALAHEARADTDLEPFQDLFGTAGINTWTPAADSSLASIDPTGALAGNLDTSVDNFLFNVGLNDPFSRLVSEFDQYAFGLDGTDITGAFDPSVGGVPLDGIGDLALGLDYASFASGIGPGLGDALGGLDSLVVSVPVELFSLVFWGGLDLLTHLGGVA